MSIDYDGANCEGAKNYLTHTLVQQGIIRLCQRSSLVDTRCRVSLRIQQETQALRFDLREQYLHGEDEELAQMKIWREGTCMATIEPMLFGTISI